MTPPFLVFLLTFLACGVVSLHSAWRFILREQLPSLVHVGMSGGTAYAAWQALLRVEPGEVLPSTAQVLLLLWALSAVAAVVLYELRQPVPFDGLFPWWRKDQ